MKRICSSTFFLVIIFLLISQITFGQTTLSKTMTHNGLLRSYRVYIPAAYSGSIAVPLLFNLHGYTSNAQQQEAYGDFRPIADTANFIIVHPNGTVDGTGNQYWDAYGGPIDDVGFLSSLIDTIKASYNIDLNRVYSCGMSNGGIMSYYLACHLGDRITAVGSVTGSMTHQNKIDCTPSHPTPVIQIHGTLDATVPYNGNSTFMPIDSVISFWVNWNNNNPTPVKTNVPNTNTFDGSTAERYDYADGDSGASVVLYKVIGGGHTWPGSAFAFSGTNQDFSASTEIWKFLRQFKRIFLTHVEGNLKDVIKVYPNPTEELITVDAERILSITISDMSGRVLHHQTHSNLVRVENLPVGLYFVKVNTADTTAVVKLLKK